MLDKDIILFDLDGTITDSAPGVMNAFAGALRYFGTPVEDISELKRVVGPPLTYSFHSFYGVPEERMDEVMGVYLDYYVPRGVYENRVYDGMEELFTKLRAAGKRLAVASSKREDMVFKVMEHFRLQKYFDFIAGSMASEGRIEKADVIRHIIVSMPIPDISRALMVGDRKYDVEGARECGLDTLGALWGYGSREELTAAGAVALAATPEEVLELL